MERSALLVKMTYHLLIFLSFMQVIGLNYTVCPDDVERVLQADESTGSAVLLL